MRENLKNIGLLIITLIITLAFMLGSICLGGKVLCDMWNWFVVPATNFNELSYSIATGIWVLLDGMFIANISTSIKSSYTNEYNKRDEVQTLALTLSNYILLLATWGIGAIIHFSK